MILNLVRWIDHMNVIDFQAEEHSSSSSSSWVPAHVGPVSPQLVTSENARGGNSHSPDFVINVPAPITTVPSPSALPAAATTVTVTAAAATQASASSDPSATSRNGV